jgi:eukaryotic-like serine/threonine-protein kinase
MNLADGTKLGPYQIVEPIGIGGMGTVYRANDPRMSRQVAIKVAAQHFTDRFTCDCGIKSSEYLHAL